MARKQEWQGREEAQTQALPRLQHHEVAMLRSLQQSCGQVAKGALHVFTEHAARADDVAGIDTSFFIE